MWLKKIALLLILTFSMNVFAEDVVNDLNTARVVGTLVKTTGKYKFIFSVTKDWKTLHLTITDLKDQPVLLDFKNIEVFVRPIERKSPFKLTMETHSETQEGTRATTHYTGDLNFLENFKGFRVNTFVAIGDERCVSEYLFTRE